jgi:hypothetical protein
MIGHSTRGDSVSGKAEEFQSEIYEVRGIDQRAAGFVFEEGLFGGGAQD